MLLSRIDLLVVKIRHFDKGQTGQETHSLVVKNNSVVKKIHHFDKKKWKKKSPKFGKLLSSVYLVVKID